ASAQMGITWGSVLNYLDSQTITSLESASPTPDATAGDKLYNFADLLQYAVGAIGLPAAATSTPSLPAIGVEGQTPPYNGHLDSLGNPIDLNAAWPTYVVVPGMGGYQSAVSALTSAIPTVFAGGQVNVLIATWQGSTLPSGVQNPWSAALQVNSA